MPSEETTAGRAVSDDLRRPEPAADLSDLAAPGGTMPPDDPFYIERAADRKLHVAAHRPNETVVIKAPRQMGKSSLLGRYLAECERAGKKTALIDMSIFDNQNLADYSTFLTALARALLKRLVLGGQAPTIVSQSDMNDFVQDRILGAVRGKLVIALDEADRILGRTYQTDFFAMLRYWLNQRADKSQPEWARLQLALVISTEPYLLISDTDRSPFNVGIVVELPRFNPDECRELNDRYNNSRFLSNGQAEELRRELLDGHPFLTRLAYYLLTPPDPLGFDSLMSIDNEPDGPFGDHLRALLMKLRRYSEQDLLAALRQVIEYRTIPDDVFARLHGAGIVRRQGKEIVFANGLYSRFFGSLS